MTRIYVLTYDTGAGVTSWAKTAAELLAPNGTEPLIAYMLREAEERGASVFTLDLARATVDPPPGKELIPNPWAITDRSGVNAGVTQHHDGVSDRTMIGRPGSTPRRVPEADIMDSEGIRSSYPDPPTYDGGRSG